MGAFARWFAKRAGTRRERERLALPPPSGHLLGASADGVEVRLPEPSLETPLSFVVCGSSGCGKSRLVGSWLSGLALRNDDAHGVRAGRERPAIVVIDPKADTISAVLGEIARVAPDVLETSGAAGGAPSGSRIRYISPFTGSFPFNVLRAPLGHVPFDLRARQLALLTGVLTAQTGQRSDGGVGARQVDLLSAVYARLFEIAEHDPRASLLWASDALTSPAMMKILARDAAGRTKEMLSTRFSEELLASSAARSRLAWGSFAALAKSTGASTCLDFADLTAPGSITLIDLGAPLGGPEIRAFYASVLLRLLTDHLISTRPSPFGGHHCQIVIDEATQVAGVIGDIVETIAQTGRSRALACTVMLQGLTAFERAAPGVFATLLSNVPLVVAGRMGSAEDAEVLARNIAPVPGSTENTKTVQLRLAATIANLRPRDFIALRAGSRVRFRSADVDVRGGDLAMAKHAEVIAAVKARYVLPADLPEPPTLAEALGRAVPPAIQPLAERATEEDEVDETPAPRGKPAKSPRAQKASPSGRSRWG